jgi:thiosulfate/3-mercaptopyruvate sulfurtransferase
MWPASSSWWRPELCGHYSKHVTGFGPLVSAQWLQEHLRDHDLRVIDFRWYLDGRLGKDAYLAGHIPGAVFVDLEGEVTGRQPNAGRHPLPEREAFELAMRQAGVGRESKVVVYDDQGGFTAARLWWLLRYFCHQSTAVLDGGLQAWAGPIQKEEASCQPGDFVALSPRTGMKVDFEEVQGLTESAVLLDARSPERYRGEEEPIDPQAGHIPGARSAHWRANLGCDGRFLSAPELRQRLQGLGAERADVISYCGSGVSACHNLLALELAGLGGARLYPGSWSDWSNRANAPVATGEEN